MQVPFSLLSSAKGPLWLRIVAHPLAPSRGVVRIKAKRIPMGEFRDLKNALLVAEKTHATALKNALEAPFTVEKERSLDAAKDAEKEAQKALLLAMIVDHEAECFPFEVPKVAKGTAAYEEVITILAGIGYSEEESIEACAVGKVTKSFERLPDGSPSPAMYDFYRLCQPDGAFLKALLVALLRLMDGDIRSPKQIWLSYGVPIEDIPKDF